MGVSVYRSNLYPQPLQSALVSCGAPRIASRNRLRSLCAPGQHTQGTRKRLSTAPIPRSLRGQEELFELVHLIPYLLHVRCQGPRCLREQLVLFFFHMTFDGFP
jgi:hypothetical protein